MVDHGGVEKTGPLPSPLSLDGQPDGADPDVGDLGYYAPGQRPRPLLRRPVLLPRHRHPRPARRRRRAAHRRAGRARHRDGRGTVTDLPPPTELQDFLDHVNRGGPDRRRLGSTTGSCTAPPRRPYGSSPSSTPATAHPRRCAPCWPSSPARTVDESVAVFPPFYSEFGKNLTLGKDVFINLGCRFQDTGGITIGDGTLIGHGSTLTTLNHSIDPDRRADMVPGADRDRPQGLARSVGDRRPRRHHRRRSDRRRRSRRDSATCPPTRSSPASPPSSSARPASTPPRTEPRRPVRRSV